MSRQLTYLLGLAVLSLFSGMGIEAAGANLRPFDAILLIAACIWGYRSLATGRLGIRKRELSAPVTLCMLLLCLYVPLNAYFQSSVGTAIKEAIQYSEFLLLLLLISFVTRSPDNRKLFLNILFYGLGLVVLLTAFYHIAQGDLVNYKMLNDPKYAFGLFALFASCMHLAGKRSAGYTILLGAALLLMVLSGERKGWVAFVAAVSSVVWFTQISGGIKRSWVSTLVTKGVPLLVVSGIGLLFLLQSSQTGRMYLYKQVNTFGSLVERIDFEQGIDYQDHTTVSDQTRLFLMIYSIETFREHPLFGIGPDQFKDEIRWVAPTQRFVTSPHNEYLNYAAETGLFGLLPYLGVWFFTFRRVYRLLVRSRARGGDPLVYSIFGLVVFSAVTSFFIAGGSTTTVAFLIVPAGLTLGYQKHMSTARKPAHA